MYTLLRDLEATIGTLKKNLAMTQIHMKQQESKHFFERSFEEGN